MHATYIATNLSFIMYSEYYALEHHIFPDLIITDFF
jgi:hypothetical protein